MNQEQYTILSLSEIPIHAPRFAFKMNLWKSKYWEKERDGDKTI